MLNQESSRNLIRLLAGRKKTGRADCNKPARPVDKVNLT
jgi:hypothetical protein